MFRWQVYEIIKIRINDKLKEKCDLHIGCIEAKVVVKSSDEEAPNSNIVCG